jgi:hypothetical protein
MKLIKETLREDSVENSQKELKTKSRASLIDEVNQILIERLSHSVHSAFDTSSGRELLEQLASGEINSHQAADIISNV